MPMSSPVSSKIVVAPSATSRSNATPIAGFAVRPDVASEPPQIVPTVSSSMRMGTVACARSCGSVASIHSRPAVIVLRVPPVCWMPSVRTGRPLASIVRASRRLSNPSQPSDTSSAPPTLGCVHSFSIIASAYAFG